MIASAGFSFFRSASNFGSEVDGLLWALTTISALIVMLVGGAILFCCVRYRRGSHASRQPRALPQNTIEIIWTGIPLLIFLGLFLWAAAVYFRMSQPPADALEIHVVGKQWMWKLQHPGGQREINELHVPLGKPISLVMISQDVIHSFFIPAFRIKQDVLPGRYTRQWFIPTKPGVFHLFCAEYCGTDHSRMIGSVSVVRPAEYARWLDSSAPPESMEASGKRLFESRGCAGCHAPQSTVRAPLLEGIYRQPVGLSDGAVVLADDTYLRDSILLPNKQITGGYEPVMPSFQGQLTEEEVMELIAYIKSLSPSSL